jgi:hypothetical protein
MIERESHGDNPQGEHLSQQQLEEFLKIAKKLNYTQQSSQANTTETPTKLSTQTDRLKFYKANSIDQSATKRKIETQQMTKSKRGDRQDEARVIYRTELADDTDEIELLEVDDKPEENIQTSEPKLQENTDVKPRKLIVKPLYIVKFTCEDARQYVGKYEAVNKVIYKHKPNVFFERAYIDPNTLYLVIRTNTKRDETLLKQPWAGTPFGGLKLKENEIKHIGAMKNVPRRIDIESNEFQTVLKKHGIEKAIRIKDKAGQNTPTVKIYVENEMKLRTIVTNGILDVNQSVKYRVDYWNTRVITCYRCQKQGHIAVNCAKEPQCARCGDNHETKDCAKEKKHCVNCKNDGHSAWSNSCPSKIQRSIMLNPYTKEIEENKKAGKQEFNIWKYRQEMQTKTTTNRQQKIQENQETVNKIGDELENRIKAILIKLLPQPTENVPKNNEIENLKAIISKTNEESNIKIEALSQKFNALIGQQEVLIQKKDKEINELKQKLEHATKAIDSTKMSKDKIQKKLDEQTINMNQLERQVTQLKSQQQHNSTPKQ